MRRSIAIVLTILLSLSLFLTGCTHIAETPAKEFIVEKKTDVVAIKQYIGSSENVKVPSEIEGKPVTVIGPAAFVNMNIKTVILPDSVEMIRLGAFQNCEQLSDVRFGENLKCIEHEAFQNCVSLKTIVFPESLTEIQVFAFEGCTGLTDVQINSTDLVIGKSAFESNKSLTDLTLNGVKQIGWGAFMWASQLESVTIPETVETIKGSAFEYCPKLKDVFFEGDLPESIDATTFSSGKGTITLHYKKGAKGFDDPALSDYTLEEYE